MGYFKDQSITNYDDKDAQKYCSKCKKMISDNEAFSNKGLCNNCKEIK